MLTKLNSSALISGASLLNNNYEENMSDKKVKLISVCEHPFGVKYDSVKYGDVFEEEGIAVRELLGSGKALEATEENVKKIKAELALKTKTVKEK